MTTRNNLDKVFGPVGSTSGIFIFLVGLIMTYYSWSGLILALIGAFVGFTSTSTVIDFDKKRIRFSNNIFGIFPIGPWVLIKTDMKVGIKKSHKVWRAYSRSNRTFDMANNDYRIMLYDAKGKELMPLQKANNLDTARLSLNEYSEQLGVEVH